MSDGATEQARQTYLLVDGENIDATLGNSIMGRRPRPEERPRWERVLEFAREEWQQPATGLFFLAANNELPMTFVQALLALGYTPVPLSGPAEAKVVDLAIQRTLQALQGRDADVVRVSHDRDFVDDLAALTGAGRRVGMLGFHEFRSGEFASVPGIEFFDLEYDVLAFRERLPRVRIIPIDEFDPAQFL